MFNSFGHLFRVTTWGESHGPALGCVIDGCPPGIPLTEADIQPWLDARRPGQNRFTTQRQEPDQVEILSGVFEGRTTGTPISLLIRNTDQRSKDYSEIATKFRPGHADITYHLKYGLRDYRGGGRSSARETAARVAAGGVARAVLAVLVPALRVRGVLVQIGDRPIDRATWDWDEVSRNPFWSPDAGAAEAWASYLDGLRKSGNSVGAIIELVAEGVPPGLGAPIYAKLDSDITMALMTINAVKGVEIGAGFAAAALTGIENADEIYMGNDGTPHFSSNHAGGILGGISTGQDVIARFAVKPTSSILTPRRTITTEGAETEVVTKVATTPASGSARCRWARRCLPACCSTICCCTAGRSAIPAGGSARSAAEAGDELDMAGPAELVHRLHPVERKAPVDQKPRVPGEGDGIAGDHGDVPKRLAGREHSDLRLGPGTRRVDDHGVETFQLTLQ